MRELATQSIELLQTLKGYLMEAIPEKFSILVQTPIRRWMLALVTWALLRSELLEEPVLLAVALRLHRPQLLQSMALHSLPRKQARALTITQYPFEDGTGP
jgi:hypothetical protein